MAKCDKADNGKSGASFINYSKSLVKTFVILMVVFLFFSLKNALSEGSMFTSALFILGSTLLFSIVNVVDEYIYNNILLGIGIAIGISLMGMGGISIMNSPGTPAASVQA